MSRISETGFSFAGQSDTAAGSAAIQLVGGMVSLIIRQETRRASQWHQYRHHLATASFGHCANRT
jgi:hypothetical protein